MLSYLDKQVNSTIRSLKTIERKGEEIFSDPLNGQQRLTIHRLKQNNFFINYSDTGAGKTRAAIASAYHLKLRHVFVFCPNNVKDTWYKEIIDANFINEDFVTIDELATGYSASDFVFEIFNYDKFNSEDRAFKRIGAISKSKRYDLIVFDEIHCLKNKDCNTYNNVMKFIKDVKKRNPDVKLLGATATPITTSTRDLQGIYEMLSGKRADELDYGTTANKIINSNMVLETTGFGYFPKSKIQVRYNGIDSEELFANNGKAIFKTELANIDGSSIEKECIKNHDNLSKIERLHLNLKFDAYKHLIRKGTVIYTEYTYGDKILFELKKLVEDLGFSACIYSGNCKDAETDEIIVSSDNKKRRKTSIDEFVNHEKDVLIGTRSLYVGVNGLQYVSNRLILHTIPSIWAYFHQLKGRFDRQKSNFVKEGVDIFVPMVVFHLGNGKTTSFDKRKWQSAMTTKIQHEGAVHGSIETKEFNKKTMIDDVVKKLKNKYELKETQRDDVNDFTE